MTENEALKQYDKELNDIYEQINICGLNYEVARTLREVDEIAYRTGFNDWCDSQGIDLDEQI
jgi:hypothetical protein